MKTTDENILLDKELDNKPDLVKNKLAMDRYFDPKNRKKTKIFDLFLSINLPAVPKPTLYQRDLVMTKMLCMMQRSQTLKGEKLCVPTFVKWQFAFLYDDLQDPIAQKLIKCLESAIYNQLNKCSPKVQKSLSIGKSILETIHEILDVLKIDPPVEFSLVKPLTNSGFEETALKILKKIATYEEKNTESLRSFLVDYVYKEKMQKEKNAQLTDDDMKEVCRLARNAESQIKFHSINTPVLNLLFTQYKENLQALRKKNKVERDIEEELTKRIKTGMDSFVTALQMELLKAEPEELPIQAESDRLAYSYYGNIPVKFEDNRFDPFSTLSYHTPLQDSGLNSLLPRKLYENNSFNSLLRHDALPFNSFSRSGLGFFVDAPNHFDNDFFKNLEEIEPALKALGNAKENLP